MPEISPALTSRIDAFAAERLGLLEGALMARAGEAVAAAVNAYAAPPAPVLIFCGGGNNGGDGYAAALSLARMGYPVRAVDALGLGQRSDAGRSFLKKYRAALGEPLTLDEARVAPCEIAVDAVLGTGARLPLGGELCRVAEVLRGAGRYRVAVDLPLGTDAEGGEADQWAVPADTTVSLGFLKYGLFSYPARGFCGRITLSDFGLDTPEVRAAFPIGEHLLTADTVAPLVPRREENTHKGSFGHLLLLAGSRSYRGAALLTGLGALRMGAGLVTLASEECVLAGASVTAPELILVPLTKEELPSEELLARKSAVLLGSGAGLDDTTRARAYALLASEGVPLVLDADAITALSDEEGRQRLKHARRPVVLTPHPGELARLLGTTVEAIQKRRLTVARQTAEEYGVTLILKGAATVVAEGECFALNTSGGPSLAKGGSGDVLAGAVASLIASGSAPYDAARLAVYLHGAAGDRLAERYSPLGVRPSELADEMARVLAEVVR